MAFAWENTFVPPNAVGGMSSGDHTAIDEWPFASDTCFIQNTSLGTGTVTFSFDMSLGAGDKKGFWFWYQCHVDNSNGYSLTEMRLTDGTTTLWTDSAPGVTITDTTFASSGLRVKRIPDSAFSGDPAIDTLVLEIDVANLNAGNNRLRFSGMRMTKSPYTAAQENTRPAALAGADWADRDETGLTLLGIENAEQVVLVPDKSGGGRHLIRKNGTGAIWNTAGEYISHPSAGATRFISAWGDRVTGNHVKFAHIYPEDTGLTQGIVSHALDFEDVVNTPTDPNDKCVVGIDDEGAGDQYLTMNGVGDAASHQYGGSVVFDAWVWVTSWIQDSGNNHAWLDDVTTPIIDNDNGSNNLFATSFGDRESNDRPFQGRWKRFIEADVPAGTYTETDITDAANELVNPGGGAVAIEASPVVLSLAAAAASPTPGALAVNASPVVVALTTEAPSPLLGALMITASPVTLLLSTQEATPAAVVAIEASPVVLVLSAQPADPALEALVVSAAPILLNLAAQAPDPTPASLTVNASPVVMALATQAGVPTLGPIAIMAAPALLTLNTQPASPAGGPIQVDAEPVVLTVAPQQASPELAGLAVQASPVILALTAQVAQPIVSGAPVEVSVSPIIMTLSGEAVAVNLGALTISASPAVMSLLTSSAAPDLGALQIDTEPIVMALTGGVADPALGAIVIEAVAAVLNLSVGEAVPDQAGAVVVTTDPITMTLTASVVQVVGGVLQVVTSVELAERPPRLQLEDLGRRLELADRVRLTLGDE